MAKDNRPGIILYLDDLDAMEELSDEEMGQLVRLLKEYEETGERKKLQGALGMAYSFLIPKLERDRERYTKSCRQRSEAARKRWEKDRHEEKAEEDVDESAVNTCENMQSHISHSETMRAMQKEKENVNEKEKENEHEDETEKECAAQTCHAQVQSECGGDGNIISSEMFSLIARYQELSGERYALVRENFLALSKQYTTDWIARAMECAIKAGNLQMSYIRGILRNWVQSGKPDEREFRDKPRVVTNPALAYEQRTNNLDDLMMDL